jgi:ribonucleoside-triphosphate reductase
MAKCGAKCEVYSRVVGYFRPVADWNIGKKQEFKDRKNYQIPKSSTKPALREGEK